jgi:hypothetical protein
MLDFDMLDFDMLDFNMLDFDMLDFDMLDFDMLGFDTETSRRSDQSGDFQLCGGSCERASPSMEIGRGKKW